MHGGAYIKILLVNLMLAYYSKITNRLSLLLVNINFQYILKSAHSHDLIEQSISENLVVR